MNDLGNLAYSIIKYEFKEDVDRFPMSYVSGWLGANVGELNALVHESFYVNESGNFAPYSLNAEESGIFSKMYAIHFYQKAARDTLRGVIWGGGVGDWSSIKEGDTSIQKTSKNSIARTLREAADAEAKQLTAMVYQYNSNKSQPLQVSGADGEDVSVYYT